jgi:transposase-like protein
LAPQQLFSHEITLGLLQSTGKLHQYGLTMGKREWDQAQFTNLRAQLGRSVPGTRVTVPAWIKLSADSRDLVWDGGPPDAKIRVIHTQAERQLLNDFVQLWDREPESILKFAKRWGVLWLDKFGRPCQTNGPHPRREPIETWRYWSKRAQAVLNIAANLKLGKLGELDDWRALRGLEQRTGGFLEEMDRYAPFITTMLPRVGYPFRKDGSDKVDPRYKRSVKSEIAFLAVEATLWLRLGRVGFGMGIGESGWGLLLDYNECTLAALALQLALVLADVDSLFICTGCQKPYPRKKKAPKPGQANFCDECGRRKAVQRADERRRSRMTTARQLARAGVSVRDIATRLGAKPATIQGWVKDRPKL